MRTMGKSWTWSSFSSSSSNLKLATIIIFITIMIFILSLLNVFLISLLGSRASLFTFKSSSIDEEIADKQEDTGISEKEMEDLAAILAERILQVLIFSAKFSPVITPQNFVNSQLLFQHAGVTGYK